MLRLFTSLDHAALTCQPMDQYSFDQSKADAVLRESGYSVPVVIDATDTDVFATAAEQHTPFISFLIYVVLRESRKLSCVVVW